MTITPKQRQKTRVVAFRLRPSTIELLKELSGPYGGVGRAIQVATELLWVPWQLHWVKKTVIQLREGYESERQELFSFAVLPRTQRIIEALARTHYEHKNNVIRACVHVLYDIQHTQP